MAVFTLEDEAGSVEVVVFPEAFAQFAALDRERRDAGRHAASSKSTRSRREILATEIMPLDDGRASGSMREVGDPSCRRRRRTAATTFEALWPTCSSRHRGDRRVSSSS